MKSTYFTIQPGIKPPPQNACWLKSVLFLKARTGFTSSTFPIQLDISQNQLAAITLNTGSPRTLSRRDTVSCTDVKGNLDYWSVIVRNCGSC
jgi:hypothetical protein